MLDIANQPVVDKFALIGACARLPLSVDADRLRGEIGELPAAIWGTTAGRVGVHREAEAVFLRGHAPAKGELPVEDRPPLDLLPYTREIIEDLIPAPRLRCLLARLGPGVVVPLHVDRAPYFAKTVRIHIPVQTHDAAYMVCHGLTYSMRAGEVWALNNSTQHGVWNAHSSSQRTHLICDFLPSPALRELLARGDRHLGQTMNEVNVRLAAIKGRLAAGG